MSVSSPLSPLCQGNKFTFEQPLRPHCSHYSVRLFKMLKCPLLLLSVFSLLVLGTLMIMSVHGAPVLAARSASNDADDGDVLQTEMLYTALPSPPVAREERDTNPTSSSSVPTAPLRLPFIKNSQCTLHIPGGETTPKLCGLRQLDVTNGESGIKSWKPARCRPFHCKCVATKEVHRMKRTLADNKTTVDFHRFRVFECV